MKNIWVLISIAAALTLGVVIGRSTAPVAAPIVSTPTPTPTPTPTVSTHTTHNDMQGAMDSMTAGLLGKTGDEFDKAFLSEMIVHHEGAIAMAELVRSTSKRPELLTLADVIITAQSGEIAQMKNWLTAWFAPTQ